MLSRGIASVSNSKPFFSAEDTRHYLTFEPDGGGWNNIRMSMETVLGMAIATGRVLSRLVVSSII